MNCPKCNNENMVSEVYEEVKIERCPVCKGVFLDKGEFNILLKKKLGNKVDTLQFSSTSDQMDSVKAVCPVCKVNMVSKKGSAGIKIDFCPKCEAVFLDQGELASFQTYV